MGGSGGDSACLALCVREGAWGHWRPFLREIGGKRGEGATREAGEGELRRSKVGATLCQELLPGLPREWSQPQELQECLDTPGIPRLGLLECLCRTRSWTQ